MLRRLLIIIGGLWVVIILVLVGSFVVNGGKSVNASQRYTVSRLFASATAFGTDSAVFSNGQELATYNYTDGQAKPLSSDVGLNYIDSVSVSPNDQYVVFHDQYVTQSGTLASQLRVGGLDPTLDYWWVFNVQKQTYQPLPQNVLITKVDNDHVYALAYNSSSGEVITTYQIANLQKIATISIPGSTNFFATQNGFLLQATGNKVLLTKDGVVNKQLFTSAVLVGVSADGQTAVAVRTQNGTQSLEDVNLQSNVSTTVASKLAGAPAWLNSGVALYLTSDGKLSSYNTTTNKAYTWRLSDSLNPTSTKLVGLLGSSAALINDSSGNYYLIGNNLAPTKAVE